MKLIELFENTILTEQLGIAWWISPNGKVYKFPSFSGHKYFIVQNIELFNSPETEHLEFNGLYDRAFDQGWVRLGSYHIQNKKTIYVEGKRSALKRSYSKIFKLIQGFDRIEVDILGEQPITINDTILKYEVTVFKSFVIPQEIEDLENFLRIGRT